MQRMQRLVLCLLCLGLVACGGRAPSAITGQPKPPAPKPPTPQPVAQTYTIQICGTTEGVTTCTPLRLTIKP